KLLMKHEECGREFMMTPNGFLNGNRCPHCALESRSKKRSKGIKALKREVNEISKGEYEVLSEDYVNGSTKVKFHHVKCGNVFDMTPTCFLSGGNRCPRCKESKGEERIRRWLEANKFSFKQE